MPFVQKHHSQALPDNLPCINVYTLPSIDSHATEPQLIASYGLPPFVSVATVNAPPNSVARCTDKSSPPALVFVTLISMLYWVPMSVFVKEGDAVDAFQTCHPQPRMVPWEEWGPTSLHPAGHSSRNREPIGVSGLRVIHKNTILDFNAYDAATDVYAPPAGDVFSVIRRGPADWTMRGPTPFKVDVDLPTSQDSALRTRGHWYRQTLHVFDGCDWMQGNVIHITEENDDVKVCKFMNRGLLLTYDLSAARGTLAAVSPEQTGVLESVAARSCK